MAVPIPCGWLALLPYRRTQRGVPSSGAAGATVFINLQVRSDRSNRAIRSAPGALAALVAACIGTACVPALAADPGVTGNSILFGQSAALDGPAAALGSGMKLGIEAAFKEANDGGGIGGRTLTLQSIDDGYEPPRAVENTRKLIDDGVFALIGPVGTPTSLVTQPIATEAGVPFIGPFTGAGFLRAPELDNVVNVRATYDLETETWIERLTTDLGATRIAILYQNDGFGKAGLSGVKKAMEKRGLQLVAEGTYRRNTTAVKTAILQLRRARPDAVVMVGAYKPCAEFIKLSRRIGFNPTFVNISFVGSDALASALGEAGAGVVITQVVPFPWDRSIKLVDDYHKALAALAPDAAPGFVSLEGYMVGRVTVMALSAIEGEPTRDALIAAVKRIGTFDLGGVTLEYGPEDNQGMDRVFLTVIDGDGGFRPVERLSPNS